MPVATIALDTQYQPPLAATISSRGLALHQVFVQHDGKTHDIVVGPERAADFTNAGHKYQNVIIGRYSNRVPTGNFDLEKDGAKASLTSLPNESPQISLHGGPVGFDAAEWTTLLPKDADPTLFSATELAALANIPEGSAALFKHVSPDGDQGFPGTLEVQVLFVVVPAAEAVTPTGATDVALGSLSIVYRAKVLPGANGAKTVTPVNLTQHWGFNLDASLLSSARQPMTDVKGHILTIDAASTVELDDVALATGALSSVDQTPEHQHDTKSIGEKFPASGYDSFYVFRESDVARSPLRVPASEIQSLDVVSPAGILKPFSLTDSRKPLVTLSSPKSGITTHFTSNQPGVQFYSGNFMNGKGGRKRIHGGNGSLDEGDGYPAASAAFLEFHELLAAWLHPYSSAHNDTLLTSDGVYNNYVRVDVVARAQSQPEADM